MENEIKIEKENRILDFSRIILSFVIIALHYPPTNNGSDYTFIVLFCRVAVPFYFICAGYFFKLERMKKWVIRLLKMYILWSLVYFPIALFRYMNLSSWVDVLSRLFLDVFFKGIYYHLWYFIALFQAGVVFYILIRIFKMNIDRILILSIFLHLFGLAFNNYLAITKSIPVLGSFMQWYVKVFESTYYNGYLFGLLFFTIGYFIKNKEKIIEETNSKILLFLTCILIFIVPLEENFSQSLSPHKNSEYSVSIVILSSLIFILCIHFEKFFTKSKGIGFARNIRKIAVLIYGCHCFVAIFLRYLFPLLSGFREYFFISIISILLASALFIISKYQPFKWLRYLY